MFTTLSAVWGLVDGNMVVPLAMERRMPLVYGTVGCRGGRLTAYQWVSLLVRGQR